MGIERFWMACSDWWKTKKVVQPVTLGETAGV